MDVLRMGERDVTLCLSHHYVLHFPQKPLRIFIFMLELIIQATTTFAGMSNATYTHITIKGKGISVSHISRDTAKKLIEEHNLTLEPPEAYQQTNYALGRIYTDGKFKQRVNKNPILKARLIKIIDKYDY